MAILRKIKWVVGLLGVRQTLGIIVFCIAAGSVAHMWRGSVLGVTQFEEIVGVCNVEHDAFWAVRLEGVFKPADACLVGRQ